MCVAGGGGGWSLRLKTPDNVSFWGSEFLTHPMISVFQGPLIVFRTPDGVQFFSGRLRSEFL